ncbi:hypothetical protein CR152_26845 [Massilia violaceinigra]|uniref:Uncharacterized protein n=1 Tax=Massilia violaceinigra TaxID=2045208 RepID=A0A2D2DRW5_9BURK|nr:hypothetical protein [Massilia violaceinigra]ATQ77720.1 hypothetical protein CR152_26845 [Massilia violaceinigra]
METSDAMRQKMIDEVLAAPPGGDAVAREAALRAWERLANHLSPLIGETALCAMYARARHVTFPDMHPSPAMHELRSTAHLLDQLATQLASMAPQAGADFNRAMLQSFTRLLSGLIGEALTVRLMNTAWTERSGGKST